MALFLAPVVRHDAFYALLFCLAVRVMCIFLHACHADSRVGVGGDALLFCLAVRVYVYFSARLSRGLTGWVGGGVRVGGGWGWVGGLDSVLLPASCCIFFSPRA